MRRLPRFARPLFCLLALSMLSSRLAVQSNIGVTEAFHTLVAEIRKVEGSSTAKTAEAGKKKKGGCMLL